MCSHMRVAQTLATAIGGVQDAAAGQRKGCSLMKRSTGRRGTYLDWPLKRAGTGLPQIHSAAVSSARGLPLAACPMPTQHVVAVRPCSWMSSTTSAQLREIGCHSVYTQPSQSAEGRRVAQQAHAAAVDGGSQQFAQGTRTRPTAGATAAALVHRTSPPCNRQSTTRPPVTQSGEDEWSPRLNYPRLAARGTHVELYTSATRTLR
jgi:hypothetical protein